jgi:hypothetical protein
MEIQCKTNGQPNRIYIVLLGAGGVAKPWMVNECSSRGIRIKDHELEKKGLTFDKGKV